MHSGLALALMLLGLKLALQTNIALLLPAAHACTDFTSNQIDAKHSVSTSQQHVATEPTLDGGNSDGVTHELSNEQVIWLVLTAMVMGLGQD